MGSELEIRRYCPGDEEAILALFRKSYGRDMSRDYWAWRFRESPAGPGTIYLAWDGDVLAAHYAITAVEVRLKGSDWLTGLSGTTMTHPRYRGQGLFPLLAEATYKQMARAGMLAVWGFPNAISHRGFVRDLGWVDVYEVPTLRLTLEGRLRLPAPSEEVVEVARFDARFDRLWAGVQDDAGISVRRDSGYLRWRFRENPAEEYRILTYVAGPNLAGYAVFKHYRNELQVVDVLAVPDVEVGLALISKVARLGLQEGAASVSLWLNVTHQMHHALERAGFANGEPVTYFGARALKPGMAEAGLYDYSNWYLTMADSDVF
jgi:GNAT superfamily N-acetyltransferase